MPRITPFKSEIENRPRNAPSCVIRTTLDSSRETLSSLDDRMYYGEIVRTLIAACTWRFFYFFIFFSWNVIASRLNVITRNRNKRGIIKEYKWCKDCFVPRRMYTYLCSEQIYTKSSRIFACESSAVSIMLTISIVINEILLFVRTCAYCIARNGMHGRLKPLYVNRIHR